MMPYPKPDPVSPCPVSPCLAASDTEAVGGDLAYQYGTAGSLAGIGLTTAQQVMATSQLGTQAQALRPLSELQTGTVKLT